MAQSGARRYASGDGGGTQATQGGRYLDVRLTSASARQ